MAIHSNHPTKDQIDWGQLERLATAFQAFGDVFTLNYDLFLYHIVMLLADRYKLDRTVRPYSDYFWGPSGPDFLRFEDHQDYPQYKLLYYLHGALFIFRESYETTLKVKRSGDGRELLDVIEETIEDVGVPMFVAEGESREKLEAINSNYYLQFALEELEKSASKLVVFGASLSAADQHIVEAIKGNNRDLAVAVHVDDKDEGQIRSATLRVEGIFPRHDVRFFNSNTPFDFSPSRDVSIR